MKLTKLIGAVGISLSCIFLNSAYSQTTKKESGNYDTKFGTYNTKETYIDLKGKERIRYYNKGERQGAYRSTYGDEGNADFRVKHKESQTTPKKVVDINKETVNLVTPKKNNSNLDGIVKGALIIGESLWLLNELFKPRQKNYAYKESPVLNTNPNINSDYTTINPNNPYLGKHTKDWWKEPEKPKLWWEEEKEKPWYEQSEEAWKPSENRLEKDLLEETSKGKKVYIKYLAPLVNEGAKTAIGKTIPGGSVIYEVVRDGPEDFWLKKVEDSEIISGEFKTKEDEVAGGIMMIVDDFTGNYRKTIYDIAESSLKFENDVKGEKIKKKYGENSKEHLEYKLFGTRPDTKTTTY